MRFEVMKALKRFQGMEFVSKGGGICKGVKPPKRQEPSVED
jgi:hypothetical protein